MKVASTVMAVGIAMSTATGTAGVASADELLDGSFTRIYLSATSATPGSPATVRLTPCGDGCTFWKLLDNPNPGFEMWLQGDRWVDSRENGIAHSFDKETLIGVTQGETWGQPFTYTWMLVRIP